MVKEAFVGNIGISIKYGQPVSQLIKKYMSNSIIIISISFIISSMLGITIGMKAGRSNTWLKKIIESSTVLLMSMPSFLVGIVLIKCFAFDFKLLPSSGMYSLQLSSTAPWHELLVDRIKHGILPVTVLVILNLPAVVQFAMTNIQRELSLDYVMTAKSKGLSDKKIIWKYVFRNVAVLLVALLSVQAPMIISGAMITETIFSYPGMGKLGFDAVMGRDYPLIMGILLVNSVVVVLINFFVDFVYGVIDPRIQVAKEKR